MADDIGMALATMRNSRNNRPTTRGSRLNIVSVTLLLVSIIVGVVLTAVMASPFPAILLTILGIILAQAPRIAQEWERGVVLRLGRFVGLRGPGLFWVTPFVETVNSWIDQRVITTGFAAEQSLTADTVPVNVDAVLFWLVHDPQKAALEVQDYFNAVTWAAQTALRDIIGRTSLSDLLLGREQIEGELQKLIDERSSPWGVTVQAVEMRDVLIPESLQDAMSRQAQATREKQARVILGEAEVEIAALFDKAAATYGSNPTALHLRAMNMLYEGLKEKGALMIVPSSALDTMGMGALGGTAALGQQFLTQQQQAAEAAKP